MFDHTSRYARIEVAAWTGPDGRVIPYVRRRFVPASASFGKLGVITVVDGDRLDLVAAKTLGDPEAFWRIADASDAMDPRDLVATRGRVLTIPVPRS